MEGGGQGELRCWDKLLPDLLGLIFIKLSLCEILTVIPSVCKSWGEVVSGPYCWQEINTAEWKRRYWFTSEDFHRMLQMLITISCGSLRKLSVSHHFNDSMLSFVAEHASCLQTLELPRSIISDSIVEQVAEKLSNITFLDISHCPNIGGQAIRAIGNHCKSLVGLRRVEVYSKIFQEDNEAHAIATTMAKLKHLEIGGPSITTAGVVEILSSCQELEFFDMSGCPNVMLEEKFLKERCSSGLKVVVPNNINNFDESKDGYYDDYSIYIGDTYGFYSDESDDYVLNNNYFYYIEDGYYE